WRAWKKTPQPLTPNFRPTISARSTPPPRRSRRKALATPKNSKKWSAAEPRIYRAQHEQQATSSKQEIEMNNRFRLGLILVALLAVFSTSVSAQQATVNHNVNLRRDPSTSSPILAHLASGSRLTLVDATADSGFYHVRTEDDQVGWIWSKFVTVSSNPPLAITSTPGSPCDDSLWTHVYHPARLLVKQPCIAVTGIFVDATNGKEPDGVRHEADG